MANSAQKTESALLSVRFDAEGRYEVLTTIEDPGHVETWEPLATMIVRNTALTKPDGEILPISLGDALQAEGWTPPAVERRTVERRTTWYFTFGWGQPHAGKFFVVENATYEEAREKMVAAFGRNWGFQYSAEQWFEDGVSQAERYGYTQIK